MKPRAKQPGLQPKLRMFDPPLTVVPGGKQEELTQALMELLINAAQKTTEHAKAESLGRRNESETHA
jgi:hypothetical protein